VRERASPNLLEEPLCILQVGVQMGDATLPRTKIMVTVYISIH